MALCLVRRQDQVHP